MLAQTQRSVSFLKYLTQRGQSQCVSNHYHLIMNPLDTKQSQVQNIPPQLVALQLNLQAKLGAAITKWAKLAGKSKNRYYRLKELVTTEGDYLNDLIVIRDHIKKPLRDQELISESEEKKMFANIEAMIGLSAQLREELDKKLVAWNRHSTMIGQTMKKYAKFLLFYSDYFKNLNGTQIALKNLLSSNEQAKQIEKRLSNENKIVTFEDMMSKPFQRPLKYHLILRDYASKTPKNHPDLAHLNEAIECYHRVNQQNNEALENKQKNQILIELDKRFGEIIREGEGARSYIAQFQSILIDIGVELYLFSDLLLIVYKGKYSPGDNSQVRVRLDRWSYVERASDGHYFTNRIYVYGKYHCLHLSFLEKKICLEFEAAISKAISNIKTNQSTREDKLNEQQRITRNTTLQKRWSYTQLKPQFKRPLIVTVLGNDERCFEENKVEEYYVLQFHATSHKADGTKPPHQIALVTLNTLLKIQNLTKALYPDLGVYSIFHCPRSITKTQLQYNKDMRHQIRSIFIQIMLNTIFRDASISKRLDIYAHLLGVSDALWEYLRIPNKCELTMCKACSEKSQYQDYDDYYKDERRRYFQKSQATNKRIFQDSNKVQFCDRKTIDMRLALQRLPGSKLKHLPLQPRLQWVKSKFGWINHVFTHPKPISIRLSAKIFFCNVSSSNEGIEVEFNTSQKVKQIRSLLSQRLRVNLEDYTLAANIHHYIYLLSEDEPIGRLLARPKEEEGFFSNFFKKEPYSIELWLRKIWFMQSTLEIQCPQRKLQLKTQELIYRIKHQEIKLRDLRHYSEVYAWYYCFKHFIEIDTLSYYLIKKRAEELDRLLPDNMRQKIINSLYQQIEKIKNDKSIVHQNQLAEKIILSVLDSPAGSCFFYDAQLRPDCIMLKIGCDYHGIKVRDRSNLLFEFKFSQRKPVLNLNGYELTIYDDKQYTFYSKDMWKFKEQVEIYQLYYATFIAK